MDLLLFAVGSIGVIVSLILLVINLIRKKPKKKASISLVVCFVLIVIGLSMPSSSSNDDSETQAKLENNEEDKVIAESEHSQEELNVRLKEEAIEADFVDINSDKVAKGTKLHLKGEVTVIISAKSLGEFSLTTKEGDGYGVYDIHNYTAKDLDIQEGDVIEVWGVYAGRDDDTGMPTISMTICEKIGSVEPIIGKPEEPKEVEQPTEPAIREPSETLSQKNAVAKAEQYLRIMAFSKSGLIEQLEYEGFSSEDATYSLDKITVDWNEQALLKAENYLSTMAFSKSGLAEQLGFEGFSDEEATYAINNIDADWKEQAVLKAENYLDIMAFSRSGLIEQLEFEGYTNEEATYAVDQIGL